MADKVAKKVDPRRSTKNAVCTGLAFVLLAVLYRVFANMPSGATIIRLALEISGIGFSNCS